MKLDILRQRYSLRQYDPRPVEEEKLQAVLQAAVCAPTAVNRQPQRILVIQSEEGRQKMKACTRFDFDAPAFLLVCYDRQASWKRKFDGDDSGRVDAAIAATQMMLEAVAQGLGTCWVGYFDPDQVRQAYALPDDYIPVVILTLGYPAADAAPSPKHESRLAPEQTIFWEKF